MKQETLAWTLRYKLGLTGTKLGCDRAECGSCTVLIDDVPYYSCSVLTHTVRNKKVLTIEGLATPDGKLHPVQQGLAHGISGNLCRCQDYDKILTAFMRGAEYMRRANRA